MTFQSLGLIEPILQALEKEGYTQPTPIQAQAIPVVLDGRDLMGCAQTGTGKTAAFAIPIIQLLHSRKPENNSKRVIKTLILTPTRELAIQIGDSFRNYGHFAGLNHTVVFGGVGQHPQTLALRKGVDVLIATPGRLLDLIDQGYVELKHLEIFVLDEADRMLDMGFIHDVKRVIAKIPQKRQTLFFSATMPTEIVKLSSSILTNPVKVEVTPPATTAQTINQSLYFVERGEKKDLLLHIMSDPSIERALVFTRTKHGANKVVKDLVKHGIGAEAIHGNKSQNARQLALKNFKDKTIRVLVATDIAARGIDVDELTHVINYEIPNIPETYVHRIGRTGRAGASGIAISFCESEERAYLKDIQKLIGFQIPVVTDKFYSSSIPAEKEFPRPVENFGRGGQNRQGQNNDRRNSSQRGPSNGLPKRSNSTGTKEQNGESRVNGNKPRNPRNGQSSGQPRGNNANGQSSGQSRSNNSNGQSRSGQAETTATGQGAPRKKYKGPRNKNRNNNDSGNRNTQSGNNGHQSPKTNTKNSGEDKKSWFSKLKEKFS